MPAPTELRRAHERGESARAEYAVAMRTCHALLADYAELMRGTDIGAITIRDGQVLMVTRIDGVVIECDPADMGIPPIVALNFHHYERRDAEVLLSLVRDGMTFFDIGANLGWYGLHVAKRFARALVVAFEPVPATFEFLARNIGHNSLANMQAYQWGLFDKPGELVFYVNPGMKGAASAARPTSAADERQTCVVRTLDAVSAELALDPDVIKMDVEGAELMVLRGGRATIERSQPIIFAEMLRKHAATFGYHPNDIIRYLEELGYRCLTARAGRLENFSTMTDETVETNFVFLHQVRHSERIRQIAP